MTSQIDQTGTFIRRLLLLWKQFHHFVSFISKEMHICHYL